MKHPQIQADGVSFRYRSADAPSLRDARMRIRAGERVAIMGATGAGKSTLLKALSGLVPHHDEGDFHGRLVVAGLDVASTPVTELVRQVGFVSQDAESQITGRTVIDDAAVGPANLGLPRAEVEARAQAALGAVGLAELASRETTHLSGGELQRLATAGILAMDTGILALDEPTSALDPAGAADMAKIISDLAESGVTVLVATHDPELVADWAERLIVLTSGRITFDGPPRDFLSQPEAVAAAGLRAPGVTEAVAALRTAGLVPPTTPTPMTLREATTALPLRLATPEARTAAPGRAAGPVVVEAITLTHRYPSGVLALTDIGLQIRDGEFVALLGRNGAGKSTFARHLNGLLRPTSGELRINGQPTEGRKVHELASEVGYVFQNPDHQIFASTVADEIAFGLRNQGRSESEIRDRIEEVLSQVGMPEVWNLHPYRLGKGQRQRLAVASVLALEPQILVIDEPTTGQDWAGSVSMLDLVIQLNQAGHTICLITHDMGLAAQCARRAVVFNGGHISADLPTSELFADPGLLLAAGLRAPQVTELALALGLGPVRSVADFVAAWKAPDAM